MNGLEQSNDFFLQWLWTDRRKMTDNVLRSIIHDSGQKISFISFSNTPEGVEIYVLYADGVPAGYAEIDRRIEVNYQWQVPNT